MSGLAQIMNNMGFKFKVVIKQKIKIHKLFESRQKFLSAIPKKISKFNYFSQIFAIKHNNSEIVYARKKKIPIYSRAEILADVVSIKKYNYYWLTWKNNNDIFNLKNII